MRPPGGSAACVVGLATWILLASCGGPPELPPPSPVIAGIKWAPKESIVYMADDSDNWPLAWADDGHLYTTWGDGWGFEPFVDPERSHATKLSLGFAKVVGDPPDHRGINIRSETGERRGNGPRGEKASGLIQIDGTFFMFVRNADRSGNAVTLAWSDDYLKTWTWAEWMIPELGYADFADFGPNYEGARDEYVYFYSPDTPSAYEETDHVVMGRVPQSRITERDGYEFFSGFDAEGQPMWSYEISDRKPVLTIAGCANRLDVAYNAPLDRYLMTMRSRRLAGGRDQFSVYDAPEPWGPWTTVYYTERWGDQALRRMHPQAGWGEAQRITPKWISEDGLSFWMAFAGRDHFAVRRATLTLAR
jgi:hypothetical protein